MSLTCSSQIISTNRTIKKKNVIFFSEENYLYDHWKGIEEYLNIIKETKTLRNSNVLKYSGGLKNPWMKKTEIRFKRKIKSMLFKCIPHVIGSFIFFLISYLDLISSCDISNNWQWIFRWLFEAIFDGGFYPFLTYHMLFPHLLEKIEKKRVAKIVRFVILFSFFLILITFNYLVRTKYLSDFLFMHLLNFVVANFFVVSICKLWIIKFTQIKQNYLLFCLFVLFLIVNYYFIKKRVIILLKVSISQEHKFLFKSIIFLYFNGCRTFFRNIMIQYIRLYNRRNKNEIEYGIIIFYKYFLSDLLSSVLIPCLIYTDDNLSIFLNIFLFTYQISIIYFKSNPLIKILWKFLYFVLKIKKKKDDDEDLKISSLNLLLFSFNELMIAMYLKIIVLYITRKFLIFYSFASEFTDSCFRFTTKLQIRWETVILLIIINVSTGLVARFMNKDVPILIRNGKSKLFKDVFHIIAIYFYVEIYYQFYFYIGTS